MEKKKLLVSFSGGETSAFMAQWLWRNKQDEYEMIFVFANTGQENDETYEFITKCENYFGFNVVWVESIIDRKNGVGVKSKIVNEKTADRSGQVFESLIAKHGIPNTNQPHCTRELKERPIEKYAKSIGWKDYYLAIGVRYDEADRINSKAREKKLIYPLISNSMIPMTKPKINFWWSQQPFRLELKGYQGNCIWCWKKSYYKLYQIAKETPKAFDFPKLMEEKYGEYVPASREKLMKENGKKPILPIRFFRGNKSTIDILNEAKSFNKKVHDDSLDVNFQMDLIGGDSCEIYAECGS